MSEPEPSASSILFCPFCRECFEGESRCPDHDLRLVSFEQLPEAKRVVADDEPLSPYDPRFGRGFVFLAGLMLVVGFLAPLVRTSHPGGEAWDTGYRLAATQALNLWIVPMVGVALIVILFRRVTLAGMRAVRLALPLLSFIAALSIALTLFRLYEGAAHVEAQIRQPVTIELRWGAWAMIAGACLGALSGAWLGRAPTPPRGRSRRLPLGSA